MNPAPNGAGVPLSGHESSKSLYPGEAVISDTPTRAKTLIKTTLFAALRP
jgi:hypothetical protein